ncbi:hypothetical protein TNCV_256511 [Trichonephila clavipes]|nr:hypothetical protein TNCV_256511 [Trichonephila clavipes]
MGHKNQYRSRKRKFTGNQYRNKRSSIDNQVKNDTTVASNIEMKTASASKLKDLKDNVLESSAHSDEIFGHGIFDVTTLLSVFAVLCCPVCLHDELSLTEDSSRPALFGNVTEPPKIQFQIHIPYSKLHMGLNVDAQAGANSAARGNEKSQVGLGRETIPPNFGNILQVYGSFQNLISSSSFQP